LISGKESSRDETSVSFKTGSRSSNYDTVAKPYESGQRRNPFKAKPSSISFVISGGGTDASTIDQCEPANSYSKSNVFLRAARSITKTKSVSGNFIVKTTICKSSNFVRQGSDETCEDSKAVMPCILKSVDDRAEASPKPVE